MRTLLSILSLTLVAGCCCGSTGYGNYPDNPGTPFNPETYVAMLESARTDEYRLSVLSDEGFATLQAPDAVTLISIDPEVWRDAGNPDDDTLPFTHAMGYLEPARGVMGRLPLPKKEHVRAAAEAYTAVKRALEVAECYDPRHALLFERGAHPVLMIFCFACDRIAIHEPTIKSFNMRYISDENHVARDYLNNLLDKAGVKRDMPPPDEDDDWEEDEVEFIEEEDDEEADGRP